jgi:hypothetical protein
MPDVVRAVGMNETVEHRSPLLSFFDRVPRLDRLLPTVSPFSRRVDDYYRMTACMPCFDGVVTLYRASEAGGLIESLNCRHVGSQFTIHQQLCWRKGGQECKLWIICLASCEVSSNWLSVRLVR